jgi:hypothetical protein
LTQASQLLPQCSHSLSFHASLFTPHWSASCLMPCILRRLPKYLLKDWMSSLWLNSWSGQTVTPGASGVVLASKYPGRVPVRVVEWGLLTWQLSEIGRDYSHSRFGELRFALD